MVQFNGTSWGVLFSHPADFTPVCTTELGTVATPANWKEGDDVVIAPAIKDEDIPSKFPKGHTPIKPYLRMTPQPNK